MPALATELIFYGAAGKIQKSAEVQKTAPSGWSRI